MGVSIHTGSGKTGTAIKTNTADANVTIKAHGYVAVPVYDGATEFTPTRETQIVRIEGMKAKSDITINPIPKNYGLITWNGIGIRVS